MRWTARCRRATYPRRTTNATTNAARNTTPAMMAMAPMSPIFASWFDVASAHVVAFGVGLVLGFVLSNRYRITRRDAEETTERQ